MCMASIRLVENISVEISQERMIASDLINTYSTRERPL